MLILDSDHMSLLEWGGPESAILRERLANYESTEVCTTFISYEEQIRGWMSYIARAQSLAQQVEAYRRLRNHLANYLQIPVLDFDDRCALVYRDLVSARIRIGKMDLKIAATALASNATLLTRNLSDFSQVPGLKTEDWTKPDVR
jgi:tRNA(fMet)-specific endonuclease VapC